MTKQDIIIELANRHQLQRSTVNALLNDISDIHIRELFSTGETSLQGLGKLKVIDRAARMGRNPKDGSAIKIPATKNLKFSITKSLKEGLNA